MSFDTDFWERAEADLWESRVRAERRLDEYAILFPLCPKLKIIAFINGCSFCSRLLASIIYLSNHVLSDVRCGAWCENPWQVSHDVLMTTGTQGGQVCGSCGHRMSVSLEEWWQQIFGETNCCAFQYSSQHPISAQTSSIEWSSKFGYQRGI